MIRLTTKHKARTRIASTRDGWCRTTTTSMLQSISRIFLRRGANVNYIAAVPILHIVRTTLVNITVSIGTANILNTSLALLDLNTEKHSLPVPC